MIEREQSPSDVATAKLVGEQRFFLLLPHLCQECFLTEDLARSKPHHFLVLHLWQRIRKLSKLRQLVDLGVHEVTLVCWDSAFVEDCFYLGLIVAGRQLFFLSSRDTELATSDDIDKLAGTTFFHNDLAFDQRKRMACQSQCFV